MLNSIVIKKIDTLTTTANSENDGNMRERITTRFNVTNAAVLGKQNKNAQINLVHLIAIIKTKIKLTNVIEITIAEIAIVETIKMMTVIITDITIREIETSTAIEMTTVVKATEIAGIQEKPAQTPDQDSRQHDRSDSRDRRRDSPYPTACGHHKFNLLHSATEFLEL